MASAAPQILISARHAAGGPMRRSVVLHADDFGMNDAVNAGILRGFTHGLLTSTSVLANAPGCAAALAAWRALQARCQQGDLPSSDLRRRLDDAPAPFDLGVHLNLTQGRPLTGLRFPSRLLDRHGLFPGAFGLAARLMATGRNFHAAIRDELYAQVEVLLNCGLRPTHVNAHQYVDMLPVVSEIIPGLMQRYAIGVVRVPWETCLTRTTLWHKFEPANWLLAQVKRLFAFHYLVAMRRRGVAHPAAFFGTSHAGRLDSSLLRTFVAAAGPGLTEIGMHPGADLSGDPPRDSDSVSDFAAAGGGDGWQDPLAALRAQELALLTSAELAQILAAHSVRLGRLGELGRGRAVCAAA